MILNNIILSLNIIETRHFFTNPVWKYFAKFNLRLNHISAMIKIVNVKEKIVNENYHCQKVTFILNLIIPLYCSK